MRKLFGITMTLMLAVASLIGNAAPAGQTQAAAAEPETRYASTTYAEGGTYVGVVSETIYYHDKKESSYMWNPQLPGYSSGLTCGIVAGGNIVAWYNGTSLYGELIPYHTPGFYFMGVFLWSTSNAYTAAMFSQLYTDMGATAAGVTISGYLNGMSTYAARRGKAFSGTSAVGTGGALLDPDYKDEIKKNGKLMTIFLDGFLIGSITALVSYKNSGYDTFGMEEYTGAHVMAVYGYKEINYLDVNGNVFRQDIYLIVHTGFGGDLGMTRITNTNAQFDDAYITHIY
ncbi:MAG: hypothetical protein FWE62_03550 [Firmicutes bacterium]|nr:hypothetical protein [Bacillota bacterium]